jgi:hypothetical protein
VKITLIQKEVINMADQKNTKTETTGFCSGSDFKFPMSGKEDMSRMMQKFCDESGSFDCAAMVEKFRGEDGSVDCGEMMKNMQKMFGSDSEEKGSE